MEAVVLIGGFLYIAILGWFVVDRIGRFIDEGGISPYWDEEEERNAEQEKQDSCNSSCPKV